MTPQTAQLLTRFETLTHRDRVREAIALGRRNTPESAQMLADLETGSTYERMLALYAAHGTRAGATVLRFFRATSRLLRGIAATMVPKLCSDAQVLNVLRDSSRETRLHLLRSLRKMRRFAPVEAYVSELLVGNDPMAARWLPYCGAEFAGEALTGTVAEGFGADDWRRLARAHPDLAIDRLASTQEAQTEPDPRLLWRLNTTLLHLSRSRSTSALRLVRNALRHESPGGIALGLLPNFLPNEIADLVLEYEARFAVSLSGKAHRLTPDRFASLLADRPEYLPNPAQYLPRLPAATRAEAYRIAGRSWQNSDGVITPAVVAALPTLPRETEARRHLALPVLQTRPLGRLPYAAFLPPGEAQIVLEPFLKNPDADLRGTALAARVGTARYYPDTLGDVPTLVLRRANEQDPVRRLMIEAVAALPPSRWNEQHLADLGQIVRDALDASDLSPTTATAAERLIVSLVPFHAAWAALWLGTWVKERGQVSLYGLESRLTDTDMVRIAPVLLPTLQAWATREREPHLAVAAYAFGRRLRVFGAFVTLLETVTKTTKQSYIAVQLLSVLHEHLPARFVALVPELVRADPSTATLPVVYTFLHRHRQDLITPFLGHTAYSGRFGTGRTRFVLPLTSGFERWTRTQQETFAQTLVAVTQDAARDTPAIGTVLRQLAALPAADPAPLLRLAQRGSGKTAVRDIAIQQLARLDAGQGVAELLAALGDDRARVAIYALRSALLDMPPAAVLPLLQSAPRQKVTVAKEVVRLAGELHTPEALAFLLEEANATPTPHRDVRVATLRALWDYPDDSGAATVLLTAASDPDPAVASGVIRIPADRLTPRAAVSLRAVLSALLAHPDPIVRVETLNRCAALPLGDPSREMFTALVARLTSPLPDETTAAALALLATYNEYDADAIGVGVAPIVANRAVLAKVLETMESRFITGRGRFPRTARAVLTVLEADPLTAAWQTRLALAGLSGADAAVHLARLAASGTLHAEAALGAVVAAQSLPVRDAAAVEAALRLHPDERLRRVALAALLAQAVARGWDDERRIRYGTYCADPSPLVAAAAQFTVLPPPAIP